jgi:hypothetical protein
MAKTARLCTADRFLVAVVCSQVRLPSFTSVLFAISILPTTMPAHPSMSQAAASSSFAATFTSASRTPLYRDALGSVLSFLTLRELAAALAVNQEWAAAVQSIRPAMLIADIPSARLNGLLSSRLRRHVGELGKLDGDCEHKLWLWCHDLPFLSQALPQLLSLNARLTVLSIDAPLLFPARLQRLDMRVLNPSDSPALPNAVVESIGQLSHLHKLYLDLEHAGVASLSPLQQLSLLRDVHLSSPIPNPRQSAIELRALPWLHRLYIHTAESPVSHGNALFMALLQEDPSESAPLSALQWRDFSLSSLDFTDELTSLLSRLPSLERLEITVSRCTHFAFLSSLPQLTTLEMSAWWMPEDAWRNMLAVFTSNGVTRLQTLQMTGGPCTSDELRQLLSHTPSLTSLRLNSLCDVDSLSFFLQLPTLAATLTRLTVEGTIPWGLTAADLPPLHTLRQLRELRLIRWPDMEENNYATMDLAPFQQRPCSVLPHLTVFEWKTG